MPWCSEKIHKSWRTNLTKNSPHVNKKIIHVISFQLLNVLDMYVNYFWLLNYLYIKFATKRNSWFLKQFKRGMTYSSVFTFDICLTSMNWSVYLWIRGSKSPIICWEHPTQTLLLVSLLKKIPLIGILKINISRMLHWFYLSFTKKHSKSHAMSPTYRKLCWWE